MQEKSQKKIKASTEAGEAVRVREILRYVPGKLRRRPQPPSLDRRKEPKENQGVRDAGQFGLLRDVYSICLLFFVFGLSSFLSLMKEKNQKKIKASTEAGEAIRVHEFLRYVSGKLRRRPQPPCLDERKEPKENQASGTPANLAWYVMCTQSAFYFSSLRYSSSSSSSSSSTVTFSGSSSLGAGSTV